jgi:hypothetical protein
MEKNRNNLIHILDISVDGNSNFMNEIEDFKGNEKYIDNLGYHVCYNLSNLGHEISDIESKISSSSNSPHKNTEMASKPSDSVLWWDVECPVLNGRIRHVFKRQGDFDQRNDDNADFDDGGNDRNAGFDDGGGQRGRFERSNNDYDNKTHNKITPYNSDGITFTIINSNSDGSVPLFKDRVVLATAHLSNQKFQEIISSNDNIVSLPLISDTCTSFNTGVALLGTIPVGASPIGTSTMGASPIGINSNHFLTLNISHRYQPVLYKSIDLNDDIKIGENEIHNDLNKLKLHIDILEKKKNEKKEKNEKINNKNEIKNGKNDIDIENMSLYERILKGVHTRTYKEKYGNYEKENNNGNLNLNDKEIMIDEGIMIIYLYLFTYIYIFFSIFVFVYSYINIYPKFIIGI